ncbi:predicted protein [Chaetoceros tenuissimus]|uniref:Uncharacterized protein n=1 Tax=Chaetoceros tenuissimus TaxID=426638 RepID=A0AAD3CUP9_9STRA|nr:predicted protein [Chaetoceros tenuissimus]
MSGTVNTGDTAVDKGAKAGWMTSDYKFEFRTSTYPGEMEGMRRACAILLNARSEVNIIPVEGSNREIIEVAENIPKDLDGWQHFWYNRRVTRKYLKSEKKHVEFHEVHLKVRSSWRLDSMLANQQIANALEKARIKIFATKFSGTKPRAFIGNFIGPIPTMCNRTEIEKAVQAALLEDGTMIDPEFELVRNKERVYCPEQKMVYVAEVWGVNVQKEYSSEAFAAIQRMVLSDRPPLGLRGAKFVETQKESKPVKMMRIEVQNTIHYNTVSLVCDHMYAAEIKFTEGLEQYFDFMDSSESETAINIRTLLDENIGRFCNDNVQSDDAVKDMYFSRGKFHIVCAKEHSKEIMAAFQRLVTDIHERVSSITFLEIFGIHRNLNQKFPFVEAIDSVGENKIIRNTLTFACPDDIDQSVFDEFISNKGFSQEVAQVPESMNRCPNFTFTNKRQVVPVAIDPKLNSEKFWENNKISRKKVPAKIGTGTASKTSASSITSKTALDKLEKKLQVSLKEQELRHQKELQKIKSTFELQLNQVKSELEEATTRLNNKFTLLQNDTDQINRKLDLGFENNHSLISQLSEDVNRMVQAITNSALKPPSPDRVRKKANNGDMDRTQDMTMDDELSNLGSDDDMQLSQGELITQPLQNSGAAHPPSNSLPNQPSQSMMHDSMGQRVGEGC